jgi:hypothetical protein
VGFNTNVKTPLHPDPIFFTQSRHFLPYFPYETPDRHNLPDDCCAS